MQTLKNEMLTIQVSEHGAELQSIRKDDYEYLWQGNPDIWSGQSPILKRLGEVLQSGWKGL